MSNLKKLKQEADLKKIDAAIAELEFKIAEREEDINRIKNHIESQKKRKEEILSNK